VRQAAEAAHALHEAGVIHRDIKPDNILLAPDGSQAVLMDLGLAQLADEAEGRLTRTRQFVGTLRYASPEQVLSVPLDRRTDVYSLGATLWELLTLRPLYGATDQTPTPELMLKIQHSDPEFPRDLNPRIPGDLEAIVLKCLEKDRARRYGTAAELAADLSRWLGGEPVKARPVGPIERGWRWCRRNPAESGLLATGTALLLTLAMLAVLLGKRSDDREPANKGRKADPIAAPLPNPTSLPSSTGRLAVLIPDARTTVEIGAGGDVTTLVGTGTHEITRPSGRYPLNITREGTSHVEVAEVVPEKRVQVQAGKSESTEPDITRPILVLNTGGHHAPVRSLLFTPDGKQILSGGLDKVVNVWDLEGPRPTLAATFRPPIWRGYAGGIYAMALSPEVEGPGRRVLAVAGHGVGSRRGNIGLFHFPGSNAVKTGDHFAELISDDPRNDDPRNPQAATGHANTVMSLAFDRRGTYLASASMDGTARIWNWRTRRSTAILRGHQGAINALAFTPDGTRLITGGRDGVVRLWDIARPAAPIATVPLAVNPADPLGVQINALAISDSLGFAGRWVVIGCEDGRVLRYDAADLRNGVMLSPVGDAIEALALSQDSAWLATTSIAGLRSRGELPRFTCSVKIRRFPDGANLREVHRLDNIAHACTFSPDSKVLAVAGGDDQAIALLTNWDPGPAQVQSSVHGEGRSIWDVGFHDVVAPPEGGPPPPAVGYSYDQNQNFIYAGGQQRRQRYYGMVLPTRQLSAFDSAALSRGRLQYQGWTVRPIDPFHLQVELANRPDRTFPITLDEVTDRRWMSYSFIPPGPGHPRATVAVGCESGVWFYRLDDGKPTRLYAGHSGPVFCLAPSKDGK
jgi:WD40 repeat protein